MFIEKPILTRIFVAFSPRTVFCLISIFFLKILYLLGQMSSQMNGIWNLIFYNENKKSELIVRIRIFLWNRFYCWWSVFSAVQLYKIWHSQFVRINSIDDKRCDEPNWWHQSCTIAIHVHCVLHSCYTRRFQQYSYVFLPLSTRYQFTSHWCVSILYEMEEEKSKKTQLEIQSLVFIGFFQISKNQHIQSNYFVISAETS